MATVSCAFLYLGCASGVSAQSTPPASPRAVLEAVNRATVPIADIRLASRAMNHWGRNLLVTQIQPGELRRVVPERHEGCLYSVRVVYRDNRFEQFTNFDLCRNHEYLFAARVAQPIDNRGAFNVPSRPYRLVNRASKAIEVLRMSPANSRMWGPNRLPGDRDLEPELHVDVPLDANAGCLYRIYAFYRGGLTGIVASADLCEEHSLALGRESQFKSDQVPAGMRLRAASSAVVWNRNGLQIDWIYVQPNNPDRDRLGQQRILRNGERGRIDVSDQTTCLVTVVAVYPGSRQQETKTLDLCAFDEPEIVVNGR
jgi:hypothetical protein